MPRYCSYSLWKQPGASSRHGEVAPAWGRELRHLRARPQGRRKLVMAGPGLVCQHQTRLSRLTKSAVRTCSMKNYSSMGACLPARPGVPRKPTRQKTTRWWRSCYSLRSCAPGGAPKSEPPANRDSATNPRSAHDDKEARRMPIMGYHVPSEPTLSLDNTPPVRACHLRPKMPCLPLPPPGALTRKGSGAPRRQRTR